MLFHRLGLTGFVFTVLSLVGGAALVAQVPEGATAIQMVSDPALSPDGELLAFSWRGDVWLVDSAGGRARPLTRHPARDRFPVFSPDGRRVAFTTTRDGKRLLMSLTIEGGEPKIHGSHSEGYRPMAWRSDGILTQSRRDHFWRHADRAILRPLDPKRAESSIVDANVERPDLSADGRFLLYQREGTKTWRRGYRGPQEAQIWLYDREKGGHRLLHSKEGGSRYARWITGSVRYVYASRASGTFNLVSIDLESGEKKTLTAFEDDGTMFIAVAADGSKIVFRRGFDLYSLNPNRASAEKLVVYTNDDTALLDEMRKVLDRASAVSFSKDAREMAFVSGGDLWVMDTVLKEPVRVSTEVEEERSPLFVGNDRLLVISDRDGQTDIWQLERKNKTAPFWRNTEFSWKRLTEDAAIERNLRVVPGADRVSFLVDRGDLRWMKNDGSEVKTLLPAWNQPQYAFSPDGKWLAYSLQDDNFNADIWIVPVDGSREAFNLSCHPDNDRNPTWSQDGSILAFSGRRWGRETDIGYVYLQKEESEETTRERKLEEAIKKMKERDKKKQSKSKSKGKGKKEKAEDDDGKPDETDDEKPQDEDDNSDKEKKKDKPTLIDFDGLRDRIRRISIANSSERGLVFAPKKNRLFFNTRIKGKSGVYSVEFPDKLQPKFFAESMPRAARVHAGPKLFAGLLAGVPGTLDLKGKKKTFAFKVKQNYPVGPWSKAVFEQAWAAMKVGFYDGRFGNKDWDAIRVKYGAMAERCLDVATLSEVCNMMLGELNGSHLGFSMRTLQPAFEAKAAWTDRTGHLGLWFDKTRRGEGWKVSRVLRDAPAWREKSRIRVGDILKSIDGVALRAGLDVSVVLTGPADHDYMIEVEDAEGETRTVSIRASSYGAIRSLMYEAWLEQSREKVKELSNDKLGYLHIRAMSTPNLLRFDAELYRIGDGKEGLIIDVRENGGGSITDHLLTCLCQPTHAITRPRGGGLGYPQDRRIYASWDQPIIVLCNQNSFSNAEIFAHAIKTLKRGRLVGVTTAGGVISTGRRRLMGGASVRMPFRGWYLLDGEDMELNGAVPHVEMWPEPGAWPAAIDRQLEKAIELLQKDVVTYQQRPTPKLRKSSER
ncbi:MAG: S41 family peptidase [Planctomycetota bacterium]